MHSRSRRHGQVTALRPGHLRLSAIRLIVCMCCGLKRLYKRGRKSLALAETIGMGPKRPRAEMTSGRIDQGPKRRNTHMGVKIK